MALSEVNASLENRPQTSDSARSSAYIQAQERLIVALDYPDEKTALAFVDQLQGQCSWFKVGLELYVAAGPGIVQKLVSQGHQVFLDLKLHDIPNTVASATRAAASLGTRMLTLHAAGGPAMLAAARDSLASLLNPPELLVVTVLTSFDQSQLTAIGLPRSPREQVALLAQMGLDVGIRGFVCSSQEVADLRSLTGPEGVLVIPGIRPTGAAFNDQQRIATPAQALQQGASYLVIGRPITRAPDPASAADAILQQMASVL